MTIMPRENGVFNQKGVGNAEVTGQQKSFCGDLLSSFMFLKWCRRVISHPYVTYWLLFLLPQAVGTQPFTRLFQWASYRRFEESMAHILYRWRWNPFLKFCSNRANCVETRRNGDGVELCFKSCIELVRLKPGISILPFYLTEVLIQKSEIINLSYELFASRSLLYENDLPPLILMCHLLTVPSINVHPYYLSWFNKNASPG